MEDGYRCCLNADGSMGAASCQRPGFQALPAGLHEAELTAVRLSLPTQFSRINWRSKK